MKLNQKQSVDTFFKNKLRNYKHTPSDQLWHRIQANVANDEAPVVQHSNVRLRWALSLVALIVLTLGSTIIYLYTPAIGPEQSQLANINNAIQTLPDDILSQPFFKETMVATKRIKNQIRAQYPMPTLSNAIVPTPRAAIKQLPTFNSLKTTDLMQSKINSIHKKVEPLIIDKYAIKSNEHISDLPSAMPYNIAFVFDDLKSGSERYFTAKNVRKEKEKKLGLKGAYVGLETAANNTWILATNTESKTQARQRASSEGVKIRYAMSFAPGYSFRAGYNFNSRSGVEAKLTKTSILQNYIETRTGSDYTRNITLDYIQLPVFFKYKWSRLNGLTQNPMVINYKIGVQYSLLTNAVANTNNQFVPMREVLRKHDIGMVMGIDYDVFITRNLFASAGTNVYYGANLNAFPYLINENEQRANNFSMGLNFSINYMLR